MLKLEKKISRGICGVILSAVMTHCGYDGQVPVNKKNTSSSSMDPQLNSQFDSKSSDPQSPAASTGSVSSGVSEDRRASFLPKMPGENKKESTLGIPRNGQATPISQVTSSCIDGDAFSCQVEEAVVKYTNDVRVKNGKNPLAQDFRLSFVARDWSQKQGIFINHFGFPWARASVFRSRFPDVNVPNIGAENVAMNSPSVSDVDAIARGFSDQWEHSAGHFANIMGDFTLIGVGIKCQGLAQLQNPLSKVSHEKNPSESDNYTNDDVDSLFWATCTGTQIFAN